MQTIGPHTGYRKPNRNAPNLAQKVFTSCVSWLELVAFILTATISLYAQYIDAIYPIENIQVSKGLPDRAVYCIAQDHFGFMWLGTNNGLCRYDGYRFTIYRHKPEDSTSISSNYIRCLYVDKQGRLWVGTRKGLNRFDLTTNSFVHYDHRSGLDGDTVYVVLEDRFGRIWAATNAGGLHYLKPNSDQFSKLLAPFKIATGQAIHKDYALVNHMQLDAHDNLWAATSGAGLVKIHLPNLKFKSYLQPLPQISPSGKTKIAFFRAIAIYDNKILLGNNHGVTLFNPQQETFTQLPIPKPPMLEDKEYGLNVEHFWCDNLGNVWFTVHPYRIPFNLCRLDLKDYRTIYYTTDPFRVSNTEIQHIISIYEDNTGIIWLGTDGDGIIKFQQPYDFKMLYLPPEDTSTVRRKSITALTEDRHGWLWIGTPDGLYRYDQKTDSIIAYHANVNLANSLPADFITSICEDQQGRLWIGTNKWFCRYNRQTDDFKTYSFPIAEKLTKSVSYIRSISQGRDGDLWIGTARGLYVFSPNKSTFIYQPTPLSNPTATYYDRLISDVYEDRAGVVWIGSWSYGLLRWERNINQWQVYSTDLTTHPITNNKISDIFEDHRGTIWIATDGGGLNYYDRSQDRLLPFEFNYLICSPRIIGLHEDSSGFLWILTDAGISRYDPESGMIKNFSKSEGLTYFQGKYEYQSVLSPQPLANERIRILPQLRILNNHTINNKGWIFVGGSNGVNYFHPDSLIKRTTRVALVITNVSIPNYRQLSFSDLLQDKHLVLNYYQNNIIIDYALLDFNQPDRKSYAHILEGYDQDWSPRHTSNTTIYSSLPPGQYTFQVNGVSTEGASGISEALLHITIRPPFWNTLWFRVALICLGGILVGGAFILRTNIIRRQKQALEIEVAERTLELREKTKALEAAHASLEQKVAERTAELVNTNIALEREIEIRQNTEMALRTSEETARVLLNAPQDLAFLIAPDGTILALNRAVAVRFNLPEEEIIGKKVDQFIAPEVAQLRYTKLQECIQQKKIVRWEDVSRDTIYDNYFYPILDNSGNIGTIAVYARDITDQKMVEKFLRDARATLEEEVQKRTQELNTANEQLRREIHFRQVTEERLRASEQRFRDLFQNSNDPIWTTDINGNFRSVNKNMLETSGYTKKELLSMNPLQLIPAEHQFRVLLNYRRVMSGQRANFECDLMTKNGDLKNMWLKIRPIFENRQVVGIHGIGRDITQLKAALRELQAAEAAKRQSLRQFTLQLAHEIKNPLSTIKSSAQLVADSATTQNNPHIQRHMQTITRNVELCNQVIQELYAYTHPHGLQFQDVPAAQFCQTFRERVSSRAEAYPQIKTVWSVPDQLPVIRIDSERLLDAFQNIYFNALESIQQSGKITFKVRGLRHRAGTEFSITDTGVGIPPDMLEKIFQPFYSSKAKGFGIGLTVAKETIEALNGTLRVSSTLGKGTTFTITLPIVSQNDQTLLN